MPSGKLYLAVATWFLALGVVVASAEPVLWPEHQRAFFQDGPGLLLKASQRDALEAMDEEGRDRFIADFLADPMPATPENELLEAIDRRQRLVRQEVPTPLDDRARLLFLHGVPVSRDAIDCGTVLVPIEIWSYGVGTADLVLYQPTGRETYRLWQPVDGKRVLYSPMMEGWFEQLGDFGLEKRRIDVKMCAAVSRVDAATGTLGLLVEQAPVTLSDAIEAMLGAPEDLAAWISTASAMALPEAPPTLGIETLEVGFPFRSGQRVAVRFTATLPAGTALEPAVGDDDQEEVTLVVEGLLEYRGSVFEEFRVRFKRPPPEAEEPIVLVWDRRLRPDRDFVARLTIRDANGEAREDLVRRVSVPKEVDRVVEGGSGGSVPVEEVAAAALGGAESLVLVPPVTDGLSKSWRAAALVTGEAIRKVVFLVDGRQQLSRTRPPYTVDLKLADVPTEQVVTAVGFDRVGNVIAEDSVVLNKARALFRVDIVSPEDPRTARGRVMARAEVSVPDESRLESVEFLLNDESVATFDSPPFEAPVDIDSRSEVSYLTVVALLEDGRRVEDVLFLNAPQNLAQVDVGLVELFATVTDRSGRLVEDLENDDFQVFIGSSERPVQRFDLVHNLPLVVGFAMDASTSMGDHMAEARAAAGGFLRSVVRPGDKAFAVAFSDRPELVAPPTDDVTVVERGLADVHSMGWTTLYDAVVRSLFYFRGFGGRRALVVLSDGEDTASRASFSEALDYAKSSGVVVYSIGLGKGSGGLLRGKLKRLAEETGGRFFQADRASELATVYRQIELELRSQYFLTFAPPGSGEVDLSEIELRLRPRGLKVRATRGYAP